MGDVLASEGFEGRGRLRKARGNCQTNRDPEIPELTYAEFIGVRSKRVGSSTCLLSTHLSVEDWYGVVSSPSWLSQHCVLVFYRWSILVVGESTSVRRVGEWSEGGDMLVAFGLLVCVKLWIDTTFFTEATLVLITDAFLAESRWN
jgi:hypothetical protein